MNCICDPLFVGFRWHDLKSLSLNEIKPEIGVYAIKYSSKGLDIDHTIRKTKDFFNQAQWESLNDYVFNRLDRLKSIVDCPILYIGSAPSIDAGGLKSRYRDLCGRRHTIFYPILALLIAGWSLQWGFNETDHPKMMEKELVDSYRDIHGVYPALLRRA